MEPITIVILATSLLMGFWPWILDFFYTKIIPWCRQQVSSKVADVLAEAFTFLDKGITAIRIPLKTLWRSLKQNFLGSKMVVTKTSATTVSGKITTLVRDENGKLMQSVITEELNWDDLPPEIREELIRQNSNTAQMDLKESVEKQFHKKAREQGVVLEMAN